MKSNTFSSQILEKKSSKWFVTKNLYPNDLLQIICFTYKYEESHLFVLDSLENKIQTLLENNKWWLWMRLSDMTHMSMCQVTLMCHVCHVRESLVLCETDMTRLIHRTLWFSRLFYRALLKKRPLVLMTHLIHETDMTRQMISFPRSLGKKCVTINM